MSIVIMATVVNGNPVLSGAELTLRVGATSSSAETYHTVAVAGTLHATIASITDTRIVTTALQNGFVGVAYKGAADTSDQLFFFLDGVLVENAGIDAPVQAGTVTVSLTDSGTKGFLSGLSLGIAMAQ